MHVRCDSSKSVKTAMSRMRSASIAGEPTSSTVSRKSPRRNDAVNECSLAPLDLVDRRRAADLVRDDQQRDARRALVAADEDETLRPEVAREPRVDGLRVVAAGNPLDERRGLRRAQVVDRDAAHALERDEGVPGAGDLPERDPLGLGALVVGAVVDRVVRVARVERDARRGLRDLLELVARVREELDVRAPDADRAGAERHEDIDLPVAVGVAAGASGNGRHVQAVEAGPQRRIEDRAQAPGAGELGVRARALDLVPLTNVALVGGDEEGLA